MKIAIGISAVCVLTACSDASNVASSSAALDLDQVVLGDSVIAQGCTFTVATGVEPSSLPPVYVAFVRVGGNQHQCPHDDDVVLGTSYALPLVAITSGHGRVVADWTSKATPSGEAHTQLFIAEVGVGTLGKQTELAAMAPDSNHPQLGNVRSGALDVHGNALVVTGDKDGIIPDEIGSGDRYVATYGRFFNSKNTTPTIVIAY